MRERLWSIVVVAALVAVVAAVGWSTGVLGYPRDGRTFNLTGIGARGRWTLEPVNGLNYWWKDFAPATLFVETGEEVVLHLRSADVFHRLYLPEFLVGPIDVEPGHTVTVRFTAARQGVFQYYCTSMCGAGHFNMRGWVVVTDRGETPVVPPPLSCSVCTPPPVPPPTGASLVERGAFLYREKGCVTCHGPDGRGGVANDNSTSGTVPAHNTTAQKLLLQSREDAQAFIDIVSAAGGLEAVDAADAADLPGFAAVRARLLNAKEIIREGRFTVGADPRGPNPPLQMPAWQYLLTERDIDALLAYFVSLSDE
jgi:mono/diheme cytochrome c family protein